mmetsp:Transcript_29906/g.81028  ORF Transcript_29906/g.81028 Transcript_29906/m.81028 type:complete len:283 (-) Transcript_29906:108-956(-)
MYSGDAGSWRPSPAGCWDLTPAPLRLAGADGISHETRPTTSLARHLAEDEVQESPVAPAPLFAASSTRRRSMTDERPLRGALPFQAGGAGPREPAGRTLADDRPICGVAGSPVASAPSSGPARRWSLGSVPSSTKSSSPGAAPSQAPRPSRGPGLQAPRRMSRPYEPINQLLNMGFDEASARAAIAAAGGDVDRAVRIVLEDSKVHDARNHCEWEFEGDSGWVPFDNEVDEVIKAAVARGQSACEFRARGNQYFIDLDNLTQLNLSSKRTRRIRRRRDPVPQ